MMKSTALALALLIPTYSVATADECQDLRLQIENFWAAPKGGQSNAFVLTPLALSGRNPATTMPQLAMVCRKDSLAGTVTLLGNETPFNAPLQANECRLVATLGIESISASAGDDLDGDTACGSFQIIR